MTTRDSLICRILTTPEDVTLKGAYADWLDDYGSDVDKTFAAYIRAWVAKETHEPCPKCDEAQRRNTGTGKGICHNKAAHLITLSGLRTQHEASWRRVPCVTCEGRKYELTGAGESFDCRGCNGTGFTGPLSEIEETRHGLPEVYMQRKWRHSVEWSPFPVVRCRLDELGQEVLASGCQTCRAKPGEQHTRFCSAVRKMKWQPSDWAQAVVRMGGAFAVSDREPYLFVDGAEGPGNRREKVDDYGWHREGRYSQGGTDLLPATVFNEIPKGKYDGDNSRYFGTVELAHAALNRSLLLLTLKSLQWLPQQVEVTT